MGEIKIVTSSLRLAKVVKVRDASPIQPGKEAIPCDFFQNDFILFVNVEWFVGTKARQLMHRYPSLKPMKFQAGKVAPSDDT